MSETAAIAASAILAALAVFQAFLAAGAPIGRFAWGGGHRILPPRLRLASAASIVLYVLMMVVILDRAGILSLPTGMTIGPLAAWALAAYFVLGVAMNLASRSRAERAVMTPVAGVLAILTIIVAAGP